MVKKRNILFMVGKILHKHERKRDGGKENKKK
jgi:hypothetical protein